MDKMILDEETLSAARAMMKDKFPKMIEYFLEDADKYMSELRAGIAEKSAEKIASPAHTIKSSSLQVGAARLSDIARKIEEMAREQKEQGVCDEQGFALLFTQLEKTFIETKSVLK